MRRNTSLCAVAIALLLSPLFIAASPNHPADAYPTTFENARVDVLADGKIVINFDTRGEHRGLVTFNLAPDAAGVLKGDWVIAERYTDNTDPATGVEPPPHVGETAEQHETASANTDAEHPHRDYVRYIDNGTLAGSIDAAAVDFDADGRLIDFRAQITVTVGTRNFDGAAGNGLAELNRGMALALTGGQR